MPLSLREVQDLTVDEVLDYVPQLTQLGLSFFDADYVLDAYRDRERVHVIRSLLMRERGRIDRVERNAPIPPPLTNGRARIFVIDQSGSEVDLGNHQLISSGGTFAGEGAWSLATHQSINRAVQQHANRWGPIRVSPHQPRLENLEMEEDGSRKKRKTWEVAFLEEEKEPTDFPAILGVDHKYDGVSVPEDSIANMGYTLREIAEMLPPSVLGVHLVNDQPYNLVFRAEREDDPRKRLLKEHGWFTVKNCPAVLYAPPTLEAYNTLEETGLEYKFSPRARRWNATANPRWDGEMEFPKDCPLFDFQREAVSFLWGRKRAMLSLSPGLGKTLTAAYAAGVRERAMHDCKKILLVCPASLLHYWYGELSKWSEYLPCYPMRVIWHKETGLVPRVIDEGQQFWVITNPETLVRYTDQFDQNFDLMIADESIMYKHRESNRSQKINSVARSVPKVWLLTGAPATRYLDDMWHQFHILDNRGYSSYWRFAQRYCVVEETPWAKQILANKRHAEEEIKENFADVYFARNQDQVANIPDWLFEDIDIPMKPKQDMVYSKLRKELLYKLDGMEDGEFITVTNRLSLMLRSLQAASNPLLLGAANSSGKWSVLPELMEIYPGPYILWVNFVRTGEMMLDTLQDKFGAKRVVLANGGTPMLDRTLMVNAFQEGQHDVIILNSTVGKFGFTLTKARTAFFLERDYNDSYFQCLHRNRRIGTTQSPVIVNMRSITRAGGRTIDHVVHDALDYRNGMIKKVTVGDLRRVMENESD